MKRRKTNPWKEAEAFGSDMALLEENLRLTPRERVRAHREALALAEKLQSAMKAHRERSRNAA